MDLNDGQFQTVKDDLEDRGATVCLAAYVGKEKIDYTILAHFPSGMTWEIVEITERD